MFASPYARTLNGTLAGLPGGFAGVRRTLAVMRQMVRAARVQLDILSLARSLIYLMPEKDEVAEATALFLFVRDGIRYTKDILNVETLSTPEITLATRVGDCDDKSTLLATLFECVGYPTRFVVTGYSLPNAFEHVFVQVLLNGEWIDADSTERGSLGYSVPGAQCQFIERI